MSFSFLLTIADEDLTQLVGNNFNFAVVKNTCGLPFSVQWFSVPIQGKTIGVSWGQQFQVVFTNTQLVAGATIVESGCCDAQLGKSYAYGQASFEESPGDPKVSSTQIGIRHNYPQRPFRNFGINQKVAVNGTPKQTPATAAVPVAYCGGTAIFECSQEDVTVYFTPSTVSGQIITTQSSGCPLSLLPDQPQNVFYTQGVWSTGGPPTESLSSPVLEQASLWSKKFKFTLSAPMITTAFAHWLNRAIQDISVHPQGPLIGVELVEVVSSATDHTKEILSLKNQVVNIDGMTVKIVDVEIN